MAKTSTFSTIRRVSLGYPSRGSTVQITTTRTVQDPATSEFTTDPAYKGLIVAENIRPT